MREYNTVTEAFESIYHECIAHGTEVKGTKAIYNVCFKVKDPRNNWIHTTWRNWTPGYAEHEMDWYDSQDREPMIIQAAAGLWGHMGKPLNSNYGYQLHRENQYAKIVNLLANDKRTRRAVMTVYDGKEVDDYEHDTPCLLSLGFKIIDDKLNMTVHFRSNDAVYGFCNDFFTLSLYQWRIVKLLRYKWYPNLRQGYVFWIADDMHVYEKHWEMHGNAPKMSHG